MLVSAAQVTETFILGPNTDERLHAAINDMKAKLGQSFRHNFNKLEVQAAYFHLLAQIESDVVAKVLAGIPKVRNADIPGLKMTLI
jgi:hypothetical protein